VFAEGSLYMQEGKIRQKSSIRKGKNIIREYNRRRNDGVPIRLKTRDQEIIGPTRDVSTLPFETRGRGKGETSSAEKGSS